jgi:hypothetical protein
MRSSNLRQKICRAVGLPIMLAPHDPGRNANLTFMTRLISTLLAAAFLPWTATLHAREATKPYSQKHGAQPLAAVPQVIVAATDVRGELARDARIGIKSPLRVASPEAVDITTVTHGVWEVVPGGQLWRLRIHAPGATDLNLGFSRFQLYDGTTVHFSAESEDYVQGAFTSRDNKPHKELWTPVLPGDRMVIEMFVPDGARTPEFVLTQINRGYRDMFRRRNDDGTPRADACQNDVICPVGDPWRNEIRSVARYMIAGQFLCSGQLINNVAGDRKNFFLTATHCSITPGNDSSLVFYWNYQSPVCGQQGGGSLAQNQTGAILRMSKVDVDVALVELEDVPATNFNVYYAGWDRTSTPSPGAVGIHHPSGDEKSISFSSSTLVAESNCVEPNGVNTHWRVIWNDGVTEQGSSGSGIWNPVTRRLVGVLTGGSSFCDAQSSPDCYGQFAVAWASGNNAGSRLRDWLDPLNLNSNFVAGLDSVAAPAAPTAKVVGASITAENCSPSNGALDPSESVTVSITVTNSGGVALTNLVGTLLPGTGVTLPGVAQNYGAIPVGGATVTRPFTFIATGACGGTVSVRVQLQQGGANLGIFTNTFMLGVPNTSFVQNFDSLAVPTLPAGWSTSATNAGANWISTNAQRDTLPNSIFTTAPGAESDSVVTSPSFGITTTSAQVTFRHRYDFENTYDGGVLEISIGSGPFVDILTAGGVFLAGSYTATIDPDFGNSLGGRMAWSGLTANFITTTVRLPASTAGQSVRLRWRAGTDSSNGGTGWYVDSLIVGDGIACCSGLISASIMNLRQAGGNVAFSFQSALGQSYQVEAKSALEAANWQTLETIVGDGTVKHFTNTHTPNNRFFRLRSP